jgi:hypothetical protein
MKAAFSITYNERLDSYIQTVQASVPGFFIRWIIFLIIGVLASSLLVIEGLTKWLSDSGYWYLLLGTLNGVLFTTVTYKNVNLKRSYNRQIKDRTDWNYDIEIEDNEIRVKTDKSNSIHNMNDIDLVKELKRYLLIKTKYGNLLVLPKAKLSKEFIDKIKDDFQNKGNV